MLLGQPLKRLRPEARRAKPWTSSHGAVPSRRHERTPQEALRPETLAQREAKAVAGVAVATMPLRREQLQGLLSPELVRINQHVPETEPNPDLGDL